MEWYGKLNKSYANCRGKSSPNGFLAFLRLDHSPKFGPRDHTLSWKFNFPSIGIISMYKIMEMFMCTFQIFQLQGISFKMKLYKFIGTWYCELMLSFQLKCAYHISSISMANSFMIASDPLCSPLPMIGSHIQLWHSSRSLDGHLI